MRSLSRRTLFGLLVSVVFLALAFWRVDFGDLWANLRSANYGLLLLAVGVYFAAFWFRAFRWRLLLSPLGDVSVKRTYWVATIGYAANNVLPLRLGEFLRAFLLRRDPGISATASLATIAVERVLDGLTLISWLGVSFFFLASAWEVSDTMRFVFQLAALLFGGAALGLIAVVLLPDLALRLITLLLRPLPDHLAEAIQGIATTFIGALAILRHGRLLPAIILLSNAIWVGEGVLYYLVAQALSIDLPLMALAAAVAASNLATSIPSSSGGIGPFELLAKETLVLAGVAPSLAAAYAILVHVTLWLPVTIVGGALLFVEGVSLREAIRFPRMQEQPTPPVEVRE
jgi:uncharacterized protein (TIRG00374 family)